MRTKTTTMTLTIAVMAATTAMVTTSCSTSGANAQGTPATSSATQASASSTAPAATPSTAKEGSPKTSTPGTTTAPATHRGKAQHSSTPKSSASSHPARTSTSAAPEKTPASAPPATPPTTQESVLNKLPGSTKKGACVTVGSKRDVTSGTVAMGNFQAAQKSYKSQHGHSQQPTVSLYVIPKHRSMPGVQITMTPTDAKGKTRTVKSKNVEPADIWKYYSVQLPVPSPGTWRLKVSSGSDSGCFNVTFHS